MMDKNWFTRFEQDHVDSQYLTNIMNTTNYFRAWFFGRHAASFKDMLVSMHKLATRAGYMGYTNTDGPLVPLVSEFRGTNKEAWRPVLKKKWFGSFQVNVLGSGIWPTLRALGLQGSHHLIVRKDGYELHLPHEDRVPDFLYRMEIIMETLRFAFCADLLAEYIQCFVVGHPFERVNFSICMAQVNAILYHYGFKSLYHEWFDFDCFIYDHDCIEQKFTSRIERRQ